MLADISHGHTDGADVLFLVAFILAVVAAVLTIASTPLSRFASFLAYLALGGVALAFLLL